MTEQKKQNLINRPPVVVILGHVDHGKSSILEAIKDLKITAKESGGITQHIGAYEIEHQSKKIIFIDTPGHEAFSAMRSRGAKVADIAVLVIAAEEGIKPQTKEAIFHIKKADIPMIVAINKIDKPEANPEKVKRDLAQQGILVESMGGKVPSVNISAKTGQGIPELLEIILLIAEIENLKTDISKLGQGVVIESCLDANRGPSATLLLRDGFLQKGKILKTPSALGKIKIMEDFQGNSIEKAFASKPVVIIGFEEAPQVGEEFKTFDNIEQAKRFNWPEKKNKSNVVQIDGIESGGEVLNLILKTDVAGSLEAIEKILKEISSSINEKLEDDQKKINLKILKACIGEINESDIKLAAAAKAKIIGFRVKTNSIAKRLAQEKKITVINFEIIYELAQAVRNLLEKKIAPKEVQVDLGKVKVLAIFRTEKNRQIIGGKVIEGEARQRALLEIYRDEEKIGKGKIIELQKDKKKVNQVTKGSECGILYQGEAKIEEKDILRVYIKK